MIFKNKLNAYIFKGRINKEIGYSPFSALENNKVAILG